MPTLPNIPEPPPFPEQILERMLEKRSQLHHRGQELLHKDINIVLFLSLPLVNLAHQEINHASRPET